MKRMILMSMALLVFGGCDDSSEEKPAQKAEAASEPSPAEPASDASSATADKPPTTKPPKKPPPTPGSLRLVVIPPDPPILRKRKKRTDSAQDTKQRARRLQRQEKRIAALEKALGATHTVSRTEATEAERDFAASLVMGASFDTGLPGVWMLSETVLILQLAPATDHTNRGGGGGFVETGSSKVALFHSPSPTPVYFEVAPDGQLVDTAELHSIVEETSP
jgi:hypothetical protein